MGSISFTKGYFPRDFSSLQYTYKQVGIGLILFEFAGVVKSADTQRSERCERKLMGVQVSPPAYNRLLN